jgi:hypothetical protein
MTSIRFQRLCALGGVLAILGSAVPAAMAAGKDHGVTALEVVGTEFRLKLDDGRVLDSAGLVGAELDLGDGQWLRIDGVSHDSRYPTVTLHALSVRQGETGDWHEACEADPEGRHLGFPLPGVWDGDHQWQPAASRYTLTCTSGAQGKCVLWGYPYWQNAKDGTSLLPTYRACLRMARADYCGDDTAHTRNGTTIDMYDPLGIQTSDSPADADPPFRFEAGWSPDGAVCVAHTRIPDELTLDQLRSRCPRLAAAPLGEDCSEQWARAHGAILFDKSR